MRKSSSSSISSLAVKLERKRNENPTVGHISGDAGFLFDEGKTALSENWVYKKVLQARLNMPIGLKRSEIKDYFQQSADRISRSYRIRYGSAYDGKLLSDMVHSSERYWR